MSSILDALKKLEKDKIHRNEVSTAIASDILRSGSKTRSTPWKGPLALFLLVLFACILAVFLFQPSSTVSPDANLVETSIKPDSQDHNSTLQPGRKISKMPKDLPLLSGIIYQKQKAARMAILNDLPVMEGTDIAGYTLQEIFPDHIILKHQNQVYTVFIKPEN